MINALVRIGFVCGILFALLLLASCSGGGGGSSDKPKAYTVPVQVSSTLSFKTLESSGQHACGVATDGITYCWGTNEYGELGVTGALEICHDPMRGPFPCTGTPQKVSTALNFVSLAAALGGSFTCGLTAEGSAYGWGFGIGGQLGNGQRVNSSMPVSTAGGLQYEVIRTTPSGSGGACGLTSSRELYCWGPMGTLFGNDSPGEVHDVPTLMDFEQEFASFDLGEMHACGVTTSGEAYCWGNNWYGQLGVGSAGGAGGLAKAVQPTPVVGNHTFKSIVTGSNQTCALTVTGDAFCWGLGLNTGSGSPDSYVATPQPVAGGHSFVSLHAGYLHTCGLTAAGEAYCWGQNYTGELGDGTQTSRNVPVKVLTDQKFASLSHRPYCGLTSNGDAYCWGNNSYGQVGRPPFY